MKMMRSFSTLALIIGATAFAVVGCKTENAEKTETKQSAGGTTAVKSYTMDKCVVSGEPLGNQPYVFVSNGQEVKLCCKDCLADFNKDPNKYLAKIK